MNKPAANRTVTARRNRCGAGGDVKTMKKSPLHNDSGFSLVELLIVVAITGIVMTGIFAVFRAQQKAHLTNSQTVEIQQNLRAGLYMIERDARLAGYSPSANTGATITQATRTRFRFTWDDNEDKDVDDPGEDIAFGMGPTHDADDDGEADDGMGTLGRSLDGGAFNPIANNIQAIAFAYAFDSDLDKKLDTITSGGVERVMYAYDSDDDGELDTLAEADAIAMNGGDTDFTNKGNTVPANISASDVPLDSIRAVRIWVVARSRRAITGYEDNRTYALPGNTIAGGGDAFMRRSMISTIKCRNMGLRPQTAGGS
jgi:type IV pilus assembly protein PilW